MQVGAEKEGKALRPIQDIHIEKGEKAEFDPYKTAIDRFHNRMKLDKKIADDIVDMEIWD